jgi:3-deoxy-D-manno-octulosonate 8-phosphate phosphatase KdsC-like HAD superfamily phosphatase
VQRRFSPEFLIRGCKDKLGAFKKLAEELGLEREKACYAGDSKRDIELLEFVGLRFAPSDSSINVRNSAKEALKASRGEGVIREIVDNILVRSD